MFCQVIVDIVHENVAHSFTYAIPAGMNLAEGQRVLVPFGHREKEAIVTGFCEETEIDEKRIRPVTKALEDYPAILPPLMALAREMAEKANPKDRTYLVPAFSGLGAPYWRSDISAAFIGMSRATGRAELIKAGLEAIAYQIADIVTIMQQEAGITAIYVTHDQSEAMAISDRMMVCASHTAETKYSFILPT